MHYRQPLRQILLEARDVWDRPDVRPAVRQNFQKLIDCRTPALGAEVFASGTEKKVVYHTCKSPFCPSCGQKATESWQLEQFTLLPDVPYAGIVFTMPSFLWPLFQQNRHLLHDLSVLGAEVILQWAKSKYKARVIVMVMPHTFGRHLDFKPHLHILASTGGLRESDGVWVANLQFVKSALMRMWRFAVITYLREALKAAVLNLVDSPHSVKRTLTTQYERDWIIDIQQFKSKWHFLRYAGRYVRRPPIAQHRFAEIKPGEVRFWTKDLKLKRRVQTMYTTSAFVCALAEHVPDTYRHAMRYFGLWAPRPKHLTSTAMFLLLRQETRARPRRLSWAELLVKHFGVNPLIDRAGQPMQWISRLRPVLI